MANKSNTDKPKIMCQGDCGRELVEGNFYKSKSPMFPNGRISICKKCLEKMINYNNMNTIYTVFQSIDIPFFYNRWEEMCRKNPKNPFGNYIRMANSGLNEFSGARWKDSIFENSQGDELCKSSANDNELLTKEDKKRLIDKWGFGYNDEELYSFERKYDLLKNNYPEKTAMHTEALLTYIRYRVKEELATARGDVAEAQKWGQLADKASERAKINPSQLSKADLTGGLNGFGELARAVERAKDIIEILPRFKEKPQDKVDFTLWCYINYIRRMKNLPDAEYKEIYNFYEERKEEYKRTSDRAFEFEDEQ